jgi:hypothetical protein
MRELFVSERNRGYRNFGRPVFDRRLVARAGCLKSCDPDSESPLRSEMELGGLPPSQWVGSLSTVRLPSCFSRGVATSWCVLGKYQEIVFLKSAPVCRNGAPPGDCGSFAGVSGALLCFWGRFATDIPRARLLIIKKLQNQRTLQNVSFHSDRYLLTRRSHALWRFR